MSLIHPIVLSGGVGSRLWPLSRKLFPKQLLNLAGDRSLIQETVLRVTGPTFATALIICNIEQRFLIAEQLRAAGIASGNNILEPVGRNTAPATAVAALMLAEKEPDALLLVVPADHVIRDSAAFFQAIDSARTAAEHGHLITFGIKPSSAETGYGYIQRGASLRQDGQIFSVSGFVEKPDAATARRYLEAGSYYWNSGMFLFKARTFLDELERWEPKLLEHCRAAIRDGKQDADFFRLDARAFEACKSISIDYAVMEHTEKAAIVPVEMRWSDIGSWEALWENAEKDENGNAVQGDVLYHESRGSYLHSEGPLIAAIGVENLVVVATSDAVLISTKSASQGVKTIVDRLEDAGRELHVTHRKVYRPWGCYEDLDQGDNFRVKRITVNPGAKLSLQLHHKRAEHWTVVSGNAKVTCGERTFLLTTNESTFIPLGAKHRLENIGDHPLHLIEVQSGIYLGEDDIVRFDDVYGR